MPLESNLFAFLPAKPAEQINPLALAYLGDGVYEVFVRQYLLSQSNHKPHHLQRESVKYVSAKAQARALERWLPYLDEEECYVMKRGRNAKSGTVPKNADVSDYRHSTAFECLIGYLYIKQRYDRLEELLRTAVQAGPAEPPPKRHHSREEST